jgi:hypothetical protein
MWLLWLVLAFFFLIAVGAMSWYIKDSQSIGCPVILLFGATMIGFVGSLGLFTAAISPESTGPGDTVRIGEIQITGAMCGSAVVIIFALLALANYPWEFLTGGLIGLAMGGAFALLGWLFGEFDRLSEAAWVVFGGSAFLAIMIPAVKWKNGLPPRNGLGI